MGAAVGWLQRNSSRSEEGRVSWPRRRGNSTALRRVGFSALKWIAAAYGGAAGAFQRMLGARRVPDVFWTVRRPDADDRQPLTTETSRIWC